MVRNGGSVPVAQGFEHIRAVIADDSPMVRSGVKAALYSAGWRAMSDTGSYVRLHELLEQNAVDVVIASTEIEGNDTGYLVREMRNARLGANPFLVVVLTLASADPDYVKQAVNSGADDLLLTPVVPDQLLTRLEKLSRSRKPFVITHDYTGPDRRTKARSFESNSAPMIEVPNPMKFRMHDGTDGTRMDKAVREASTSVNRLKIERYAVQITWLVSHLHASVRDGTSDGIQLLPHSSHLVEVVEDMIRRLKGSTAESLTGTAADVLDVARKVAASHDKIAFADLERLSDLAKIITRTLGSPPEYVAKSG